MKVFPLGFFHACKPRVGFLTLRFSFCTACIFICGGECHRPKFYKFRIGVIDEINYKVCCQNSATVRYYIIRVSFQGMIQDCVELVLSPTEDHKCILNRILKDLLREILSRYFLVQAYWHVHGKIQDCVELVLSSTGAHVHIHFISFCKR